MFIVYALYSPSHNKIYIGFTENLDKRLERHNKLNTKGYTTRFRPWSVVYTEPHESKADALRREKELKSSRGREFIWQKVHEQYPN